MNEGILELANEIVVRACMDYKKALTALKRNPDKTEAMLRKEECERFFYSEWCEALIDLSGETIIKNIRLEVEKKYKGA